MKVLHLPYNVASQVSASVRALRAIGVDTRGLVSAELGDAIQSHDDIEILEEAPSLPRSARWARQHAQRYARVMAAIAWADVLHWHFGCVMLRGGADLAWARLLRKPGVAEFWGSDIRIADIEAADNPVYAAHAPPEYQALLTPQRSFETQARFAGAGFSCIVGDTAMRSYIRQELFPKVHLVRQRLLLSEYIPRPPDAGRQRPLIVHSPSNPKLKGTEFVLAAVDALRTKYDFDFRLVHGVPRPEALTIVGDADIFVDQLILGTHGLASLEAMGLAKPVVCYIKSSMVSQYPPDLPIVNASPDNLTEVLAGLLASGDRRRHLGLQGRAYVEKYHDALQLAHELQGIYEETLAGRS